MRNSLMLILFFGLIGCGSDRLPTYPVQGRVEFPEGLPVRHGTVELESEEHGTTATGTIQHDGTFVLGTYTTNDGAVSGQHKAIVIQLVIADGSFKHTIDHGRPVPTKFADYESSPLTVTVAAEPVNNVVLTIEK